MSKLIKNDTSTPWIDNLQALCLTDYSGILSGLVSRITHTPKSEVITPLLLNAMRRFDEASAYGSIKHCKSLNNPYKSCYTAIASALELPHTAWYCHPGEKTTHLRTEGPGANNIDPSFSPQQYISRHPIFYCNMKADTAYLLRNPALKIPSSYGCSATSDGSFDTAIMPSRSVEDPAVDNIVLVTEVNVKIPVRITEWSYGTA
ncbi:hypothetical protein M422DRAFT_254680 [Sphaerobolus stellatus SS14]|uniref:Uncharacterized protein n=1 Tax=Sphaerobolus stellatus (strain SS14) TaxID=990650 RepID=A0A0C9VVG1_SPHS4|nr:hypothetical protein M422DRAFT_254680 [Sphaerobolus stellatus SS14]